MSNTEFVGNNTAYTNDELHDANANADEPINFENTKTDLNNCLHKALTEKLKPCRYYQPGQKLPVAQKEIKLFMLHVNIRSLQNNLNNLNHELLQTRDGNRSGRPAGRVAGRVKILRPAGQNIGQILLS